MPDSKSRNYFQNIVTGLSKIEKQVALYNKQNIANLKLAKSVQQSNAKLKQQVTALKRANAALKQNTVQTQRAAKAAQFMSITWGGVARVIVGSVVSRGIQELINAITEAMGKTREFTIRIGEIRTVSQNSQQAFETWAQSIRNVSDSWGFALLDTAEASYEALSNQIAEGAQTTIFMNEAARLARIGVSDLATSVNALSSVINAYNLSASSARRISDQLFVAVDLGRFRLEDIADKIGNVAILTSQLNISFTELFATITVLTRKGVSPDRAFTLVRNVLLALIKPSEAMSDWLRDEFGAASAEAAINAEGLTGIISKLIQITETSAHPMSDMVEIFNRIRGTVGAAGIATVDYAKDLKEMEQAHIKAAFAAEEMSKNIGVKSTKALQELKNVFTVDIGREIQNTFVALNESVGGFAERLKDTVTVVKELSKALIALSIGALVVKTVAWYRALKHVAVTQVIIMGQMAAITTTTTGLTALFLTLKDRIIAIGALLFKWPVAIAAAGYLIYNKLTKDAELANRTLEENITAEIVAYRQMVDEKIAEDLRHFEAKQQLALNVFDLIEREAQKEVNRIQKVLNKQIELRGQIFKLDRMIYKSQFDRLTNSKKELTYKQRIKTVQGEILALGRPRTTGGPDYLAAANLTVEQLRKEFATLKRDWDGLSEKDQIRELGKITSLIKDLESLNGKRVKSSRIIRTEHGRIATLGQRQISGQLKLNKAIDIWKRRVESLAKTKRDTLQAQFDEAKAQHGTLKEIRDELKLANKARNVAKDTAKEARAAAKDAIEAQRGQKSTLGELVQKYQELGNIIPDSSWVGTTNAELGVTQHKIDALVTESERLAQLEFIPRIDIEQFENDFLALRTRLKAQAARGIIANENYSDIVDQLITKHGQLQKQAETARENLIDWKTFTEGVNALNVKVNTLNDAVVAFDKSLKDNMNSGAQAAENWVKRLDAVIERLIRANNLRAQQGGYFGKFITRQAGGSVGKDSVPILASPGEFIMNDKMSRKFLPQLTAMNSGSRRFESGGAVTNNNVGDINVNVSATGNSSTDARAIAAELRRELRRSTIRLN